MAARERWKREGGRGMEMGRGGERRGRATKQETKKERAHGPLRHTKKKNGIDPTNTAEKDGW